MERELILAFGFVLKNTKNKILLLDDWLINRQLLVTELSPSVSWAWDLLDMELSPLCHGRLHKLVSRCSLWPDLDAQNWNVFGYLIGRRNRRPGRSGPASGAVQDQAGDVHGRHQEGTPTWTLAQGTNLGSCLEKCQLLLGLNVADSFYGCTSCRSRGSSVGKESWIKVPQKRCNWTDVSSILSGGIGGRKKS